MSISYDECVKRIKGKKTRMNLQAVRLIALRCDENVNNITAKTKTGLSRLAF